MAQGKGILQPHHLIDELESSIGDEDSGKHHLRDGLFGQILQSTQVRFLILNYSACNQHLLIELVHGGI